MLLGAGRARDLSVGGVADEGVEEDVLARALDRRATLSPDELSSLERPQALVQLPGSGGRERGQGICPEHLPEHGGVLEEGFLGGSEPVDPRGDDSLQRLRNVGRRLAGGDQPRVLLGKERNSARVT